MSHAEPPAPWPRPTVTFDTPGHRDRFEQSLIDFRSHARSTLDDDAPAFVRERAEKVVNVVEDMIDRMGRATDDTAPVVFERPAELNAALFATAWVYRSLKASDAPEQALHNVAEAITVMVEAHWRDNDSVTAELSGLVDSYSRSSKSSGSTPAAASPRYAARPIRTSSRTAGDRAGNSPSSPRRSTRWSSTSSFVSPSTIPTPPRVVSLSDMAVQPATATHFNEGGAA